MNISTNFWMLSYEKLHIKQKLHTLVVVMKNAPPSDPRAHGAVAPRLSSIRKCRSSNDVRPTCGYPWDWICKLFAWKRSTQIGSQRCTTMYFLDSWIFPRGWGTPSSTRMWSFHWIDMIWNSFQCSTTSCCYVTMILLFIFTFDWDICPGCTSFEVFWEF